MQSWVRMAWKALRPPYLVGLLNVDLVVMPVLKKLFAMESGTLFLASSLAATAEFVYWFWFTGIVLSRPSRVQQAALALIELIDRWFVLNFKSNNHHLNRFLVAVARMFSYVEMVAWGAAPFALWVPGLAFCREKQWNRGFMAMAIGNILKTGYFVLGWDFLWRYL